MKDRAGYDNSRWKFGCIDSQGMYHQRQGIINFASVFDNDMIIWTHRNTEIESYEVHQSSYSVRCLKWTLAFGYQNENTCIVIHMDFVHLSVSLSVLINKFAWRDLIVPFIVTKLYHTFDLTVFIVFKVATFTEGEDLKVYSTLVLQMLMPNAFN